VSRTGRWHGTALLRARLEAREEGGRDARVYCYTTTSGKEQGSRPNGMGIVPSHACSLSLSRLVGTGQEAMVAVTAPVAGPRAAAADLIGWIGRSTTNPPLPSPFFRCAPCVRLLWGFGRFPPSLPPLYLFVCNLSWPIMKPRCDTKYG
jgi:hypothetical protein